MGIAAGSTGIAGVVVALLQRLRIYRALYHWRLEHRSFGQNMRFVCREVAAWIREDREMQRPPPPPHDHDRNRGHERPARPIRL